MSYEGYVEFLCEDGHLDYEDCNIAMNMPKWHCHMISNGKRCGKRIIWSRSVEETNGSPKKVNKPASECTFDEIPDLEILEQRSVCVCSCCGNKHVTSAVRYVIPRDFGQLSPSYAIRKMTSQSQEDQND